MRTMNSREGRSWPAYLLGGRLRTSTAVLLIAFSCLWWLYQTYDADPAPPPQVPASEVVPPGFIPDPNYTWAPRTDVQRRSTPTTTTSAEPTTPTTTSPSESSPTSTPATVAPTTSQPTSETVPTPSTTTTVPKPTAPATPERSTTPSTPAGAPDGGSAPTPEQSTQ